MTPQKPCAHCGKMFTKKPNQSRKAWNERVRYCSKECMYASPEYREKMSSAQKGKSRPGHPISAETRKKISETQKGRPAPEYALRALEAARTPEAIARMAETKTTHGHTKGGRFSPTYTSWHQMRQRCNNPKAPNYHLYGGRGICVCERWNTSFAAFLEDMGERPAWATGGIDRIDPNGNYEPGNCRWVTKKTQSRHNAEKTHCRKGHPYEGDNLYVNPEGKRICRTCVRQSAARSRARKANQASTEREA